MYTCDMSPATQIRLHKTSTRVEVTCKMERMAGKQEAFSEAENRVLRAALRKLVQEHELSQAALGKILGIKQQNAGRLLGPGRVGMGRATANNLARHLKYRDAEHFLLEHDVLAAMAETPSQHRWSERENAVRIAGLLKIDSAAVEAVVKRFTSADALQRPSKWWVDKFYLEERDLLADAAAAPARPPSVSPAKRPRRRTAS